MGGLFVCENLQTHICTYMLHIWTYVRVALLSNICRSTYTSMYRCVYIYVKKCSCGRKEVYVFRGVGQLNNRVQEIRYAVTYVCMYIHMCTRPRINICVYVHTYVCVTTYIHMCVCTYICVLDHVHTYVCMCIHIRARGQVHSHVCMYIHMCAWPRTYTCV